MFGSPSLPFLYKLERLFVALMKVVSRCAPDFFSLYPPPCFVGFNQPFVHDPPPYPSHLSRATDHHTQSVSGGCFLCRRTWDVIGGDCYRIPIILTPSFLSAAGVTPVAHPLISPMLARAAEPFHFRSQYYLSYIGAPWHAWHWWA